LFWGDGLLTQVIVVLRCITHKPNSNVSTLQTYDSAGQSVSQSQSLLVQPLGVANPVATP
jgi:hypothetical protein